MDPCAIGRDQIENGPVIRRIQEHLGLQVDGWPGDFTWKAIQDSLIGGTPGLLKPEIGSSFPNEDYSSMVDYYGQPGNKSNLVEFFSPFPMRLYSRNAPANVFKHWCHKKVKRSLEAVLDEILETFGLTWIQENGIDVFGGVYNDRSKRGGRSKSKHAWGVAIDINPSENGLNTPWPSKATMPIEVIEVFERHGWKSLARVIGRDAMHFEATS